MISKQTFPTEVVGKVVSIVFVYVFLTTCQLKTSDLLDLYLFGSVFQVSSIIDSLEIVFNRGEMHSAVVDYEALNVIIRYEFVCYGI